MKTVQFHCCSLTLVATFPAVMLGAGTTVGAGTMVGLLGNEDGGAEVLAGGNDGDGEFVGLTSGGDGVGNGGGPIHPI